MSEKAGIKYMQRWEEMVYARQDGYEEGRSEGRSEGALKEVIAAVCKKLVKGKSAGQIADELEQEPHRISLICGIAEKYAPVYNQDAIYQELNEAI